jgi:hypothetical protein
MYTESIADIPTAEKSGTEKEETSGAPARPVVSRPTEPTGPKFVRKKVVAKASVVEPSSVEPAQSAATESAAEVVEEVAEERALEEAVVKIAKKVEKKKESQKSKSEPKLSTAELTPILAVLMKVLTGKSIMGQGYVGRILSRLKNTARRLGENEEFIDSMGNLGRIILTEGKAAEKRKSSEVNRVVKKSGEHVMKVPHRPGYRGENRGDIKKTRRQRLTKNKE